MRMKDFGGSAWAVLRDVVTQASSLTHAAPQRPQEVLLCESSCVPAPNPRRGAASTLQAPDGLRPRTGLPRLVTLPSHVHSELAPSFPSLSLPGFGQRSSGTSAKTSVWEGDEKETLETSFSTVSTQCFSTFSSPPPPHSPPPPQVHKTAGAFYSKLPQLPDAPPHLC